MFDFFTGADPTNGYVDYLDETDAQVLGLINTTNNQIYMGVDHSTIAQAPGRSSVRIASTATYNHGLIILDLEHMPGGICGTWPALYVPTAHPLPQTSLISLQLAPRPQLAHLR